MRAGSLPFPLADSEGDRIVISSDEELLEALDHFDGTLFRLHIKSKAQQSSHASLQDYNFNFSKNNFCWA